MYFPGALIEGRHYSLLDQRFLQMWLRNNRKTSKNIYDFHCLINHGYPNSTPQSPCIWSMSHVAFYVVVGQHWFFSPELHWATCRRLYYLPMIMPHFNSAYRFPWTFQWHRTTQDRVEYMLIDNTALFSFIQLAQKTITIFLITWLIVKSIKCEKWPSNPHNWEAKQTY